MIVCGPNEENFVWLTEQLQTRFIIKQTILNRCLGIETSYDRKNCILRISKNDYIRNLILKWNHILSDIPFREIPMDDGLKLSRESCPKSDEEKEDMKRYPYREIIGALNYLANTVRPDISFAVNYLSKHIDIIYHSIRDWAQQNKIKIFHIPRENQLADSMNKAIDSKTFKKFIPQLLSFQN
jgi:hypothetical protein